MADQIQAYLETLGLSQTIKNRVNDVIKLNSILINDEISDIFICEMKNNEGGKNYTSLWLFTYKYCLECKNFLTTEDFDITPLSGNIKYCSINPVDFNLEDASHLSSVTVHFRFEEGITGDLIGTGNNCEKALEIYQNYIIANLMLN